MILRKWLELVDVKNNKAESIINRLPGYFVHALHEEWAKNAKNYERLFVETPFTD
jgi:hypothetical protein